MRIISCQVENFASYKNLHFDYSNQGLTLLSGRTGSGKSTLCDIVPWILFGKTAKGVAVDEVLSWPGNDTAFGSIALELNHITYHITRVRGPKSKDNDLFFYIDSSRENTRGRDLLDTQKLINDLIGFDYDLYLAAAYYHEFSQTAQFFTTNAKNRRVICEQLVDLSLATKLQPKLSEDLKLLEQQQKQLDVEIFSIKSNIQLLNNMFTAETVKHGDWEASKRQRMGLLKEKISNFEADKTHVVEQLLKQEENFLKTNKMQHDTDCASTVCKECGASKNTVKKPFKPLPNPYTERIERELSRTNTYIDQAKELEAEENPYLDSAQNMSLERQVKEVELTVATDRQMAIVLERDDLSLLKDVVTDYRSRSIMSTINDLEIETNKLLTNHFDAEIRVSFSVEDADKLEVIIYKDGNQCVFTQLSKGQRCLLKLSFGVAVMKAVANHHGLKFDQVFFDEALDGLDEVLKIKALDLLQTLAQEYDSIFLVEHSAELKAAVDNQYHIQLINGESVVEKA